jgi:hypothetical protein
LKRIKSDQATGDAGRHRCSQGASIIASARPETCKWSEMYQHAVSRKVTGTLPRCWWTWQMRRSCLSLDRRLRVGSWSLVPGLRSMGERCWQSAWLGPGKKTGTAAQSRLFHCFWAHENCLFLPQHPIPALPYHSLILSGCSEPTVALLHKLNSLSPIPWCYTTASPPSVHSPSTLGPDTISVALVRDLTSSATKVNPCKQLPQPRNP